MRDALPPAFDPDHYRAANPDLAAFDDAEAAAHYERVGRDEGRAASPFAWREAFVAAIDRARPTLEIGPFCAPALTGPNVRYLDVLDADGLRARAVASGLDAAGCPPVIHHVGALGEVTARFAAVFASHSIEHQPDLVRHLEDVAAVLEPGGRYHLIVPDRRYCFDHFLPDSSVADVLAAHEEQRMRHATASVIEHGALLTHNDPARHWRGDHGTLSPRTVADLARRVVADRRAADGDYLDVHAWQFTPDSFATLFATLAATGLSAFEVERVYDTPRDRAEFCAVLRLTGIARRSPRRSADPEIRVLQTADPLRYAPLLGETGRNVATYCARLGLRYEARIGVLRGAWQWQAAFNRIVMLRALLDEGYAGWALYLDADAYVRDLSFDLPAFLRDRADRAALFATAGASAARWDVNSGVAFVNFGHPLGRRLVERWHARFMALSDAALRDMPGWSHPDDQDMLHAILRDEGDGVGDAIEVLPLDLVNSAHARFIRQHVRAHHATFGERVREVTAGARAALIAHGLAPALPAAGGSRERGRLLHPAMRAPELRIAPPATPLPDRAATAIATWRARPRVDIPPDETAFAALLDAGDIDAVAAEIATLGRSTIARGHLGGDRQHERCRADAAFAAHRAAAARDALFSLAEIVGARPFQMPDNGPWGIPDEDDPATLARVIADALGFAIDPPPAIGGHLGIDAGGIVLHQRMIEAAYTGWRLASLGALTGDGVTEIGGGVGLNAWYARRSGIGPYRIVCRSALAQVQAAVLDGTGVVVATEPAGPSGLLLADEVLLRLPPGEAAALLDDARHKGARALFAIDHEGARDADGRARTVSGLVAAAGGWRRASRWRHALRAGYVEELFVPVPG